MLVYLTQQQAQPRKCLKFQTSFGGQIKGKPLTELLREKETERELGKTSRNTNGAQIHLHVKLHDSQTSPIQSALIGLTVHTLPCVLHA